MKQKSWGLLLIGLGVLLLLKTTGVIMAVSLWSPVLAVLGLSITYKSFNGRRGPNWFGLALGLWLFGIGLFDILADLQVVSSELSGIVRTAGWPLILIALGLSVLFGRSFRVIVRDRRTGSVGSMPMGQVLGDLRHGREPWVLDKDLNLATTVGDLRLDLTTAQITPGVHRINLNQFVGETVVRLPDNVTVRARADVNLGEIEALGEHRNGAGLYLEREVIVPGSEVELVIDAQLRVGTIRIIQMPISSFRVN